MKDYLGNELKVGDPVIFITPGYRDYSKGVIKDSQNIMFSLKKKKMDILKKKLNKHLTN
jgi:hypothetical protein